MLELNASDERGISIVREKVKSFAQLSVAPRVANSKYPCPPYKLIVLDEADSMTHDAQAALRRIMENYSKSTRFCLICNYVSRIIEPLASRCAKFRFRPLEAMALEARLASVAASEQFAIDETSLKALRQVSGGDMRKAITYMQSAHTLLGDQLDAASIIELAGVVPRVRIDALLRLVRGDLAATETASGVNTQDALDAPADGDIVDEAEHTAMFDEQTWMRSELSHGVSGALRVTCQGLVADGYAAKRVIAQLGEALLEAADVDELSKAESFALLAETDYALIQGADDYLQLLNATSGMHELLTRQSTNAVSQPMNSQ